MFSPSVAAQCSKDNDHRESKTGGVLIKDFTITGTQTLTSDQLARITGELIGSCFNDDSEEMPERIRASFQNRGYFAVEVKSVRLKPLDPLGAPKPVLMEADVAEGPQYALGHITFVKNHAFTDEELRLQFPLKKGALFEREKVAMGLDKLRKLYGTSGYLDYIAIPETTFSSNATVDLKIAFEEGPQYHMGKLEIIAEKESAARLRAEWKLAEGDVYDSTYIDDYLAASLQILPANFSRANIQLTQNCPEALIHVRLIVDPAQDTTRSQPKNVPCEDQDKDKPK